MFVASGRCAAPFQISVLLLDVGAIKGTFGSEES